MKIAVSKGGGRFRLSKAAYSFLGLSWDGEGLAYADHGKRTDPDLIECIEALGAKANGEGARIEIIEWPGDEEWVIEEEGGKEDVFPKEEKE